MSPDTGSAAAAACATCLQAVGAGNELQAVVTGLLVGALVRFGPVLVAEGVRRIVKRWRKEA